MRLGALAVSPLLLLAHAGCASAPAPANARAVVTAFRDCLETYYAERIDPRSATPDLLRRRGAAGGRLIVELESQGVLVSHEAEAKGLLGLVPLVERYLHLRTEDFALAEVEPPDDPATAKRRGDAAFPGSYLVVGRAVREEGREIEAAGRRARCPLVRFREALVLPLDVYRSRTFASRPRIFLVGHTIYADVPRFESGAALDEAIALTAASTLFEKTSDPSRRDAQVLIALAEARSGADGLRVLAKLYPGAGARIALEAIRAAGVGQGDGDERLIARLPELSREDRRRIVESACAPGGLIGPGE